MDATTKFLWAQAGFMICLVMIGVIAVAVWWHEPKTTTIKKDEEWEEEPCERSHTIGTDGQLHIVRSYRRKNDPKVVCGHYTIADIRRVTEKK